MGMYGIREISLRNYDSTFGASPLGRYHISFVIFPIPRTRPYINNYMYIYVFIISTFTQLRHVEVIISKIVKYNTSLHPVCFNNPSLVS